MVGEDDEFGEGGFKEAFEREAEFRSEDGDRGDSLLGHGVGSDGEFSEQVLSGIWIEGESGFKMGALDAGHQSLFEARSDGDAFDEAGFGLVLADEISSEAAADLFGEFIGVFCNGSVVGEGF